MCTAVEEVDCVFTAPPPGPADPNFTLYAMTLGLFILIEGSHID